MRETDVTEGIQVEIKERREGKGISSPINPAPFLVSITFPPNNNTAIPI